MMTLSSPKSLSSATTFERDSWPPANMAERYNGLTSGNTMRLLTLHFAAGNHSPVSGARRKHGAA
jgi:hypothetical protein